MNPIGQAAMRVLNNEATFQDIKLVAYTALCWESERWPAIEAERQHMRREQHLTVEQWRAMRRAQLYSD